MESRPEEKSVIIACPDARPPAYQAAVGLNQSGRLDRFVTSCYYDPDGPLATLARRSAPGRFARWEKVLLRRHDPEIPAERVWALPGVDLVQRLEACVAGRSRTMKRLLAQAAQIGLTGG